jgi:hypothetical protein
VLKNEHGDWGTICRPQGQALAACADARSVLFPLDHRQSTHTSVPHLSELKNACAEPISIYRTCLDKNASLSNETVSEVCGEPLKALWECTERTMGEIERKEAETGTGSSRI